MSDAITLAGTAQPHSELPSRGPPRPSACASGLTTTLSFLPTAWLLWVFLNILAQNRFLTARYWAPWRPCRPLHRLTFAPRGFLTMLKWSGGLCLPRSIRPDTVKSRKVAHAFLWSLWGPEHHKQFSREHYATPVHCWHHQGSACLLLDM